LPAAACGLPLVLLPVYRSRARRWVKPAELSAAVLAELGNVPPEHAVVLREAVGVRPNLESAFGGLIGDAMVLHVPGVRVWVDPPPSDPDYVGLQPPAPGQPVRRFALREGRLTPF
jgi:hypothetical protein